MASFSFSPFLLSEHAFVHRNHSPSSSYSSLPSLNSEVRPSSKREKDERTRSKKDDKHSKHRSVCSIHSPSLCVSSQLGESFLITQTVTQNREKKDKKDDIFSDYKKDKKSREKKSRERESKRGSQPGSEVIISSYSFLLHVKNISMPPWSQQLN